MTIHLAHGPTEGQSLVGQRLHAKRLVDCREALQLVVVDDRNEVVQLMVGGEHHGLPVRAFAQLAIAKQNEGAPVLLGALGRQGLACAEGQTMP